MATAQSQSPTCNPGDTRTFAQLSNKKDLTPEQVTKLEDLLNKYSDIFGTSTEERGKTDLVHHLLAQEIVYQYVKKHIAGKQSTETD